MVTTLNIKSFVEDKNPYVGPQPMRAGDPIFGRDREISELRHFLMAERIVLLYSPSGAGKSSLVAAGLIPRLAERFEIWGPTRVNQQPPPSASLTNRYVWSAISGFEQSLRRDTDAGGTTAAHLVPTPEKLAGLTLTQYVEQRERKKSPVLIFDQFEEILRVDPLDTEAKRAFFAQLGDVLSNPRIWALFVLREDYLAPLDPYSKQVPTHFQNRYRIDRLKRDMATEAIVRPTENLNRKYDPAAVEALVNNLATVHAQQLDRTFADQVGEYVEPLQLQVVCYDVWSRKQPGDMVITKADAGDNISSALMNYYDRSVRLVAGEDEAVERDIREWFQNMLITPDGVRSQVRQEREQSGGLDNGHVSQLLDTYLVRAEPRGFTNWYELAHDRLIAPVRDSNRKWFHERLSKLQKIAGVWDKEKRSPGLLLTGKDLRDVEKWARDNPVLVHQVEHEFLAASMKKRRGIWVGYAVRALIVALAIGTWISREAAVDARKKADIVFGRLFKRTAREHLKEARNNGIADAYSSAWVYSTAALHVSPVPVPESAGRLFQPDAIPGQTGLGEHCVTKNAGGACVSLDRAAIFSNGSKILYVEEQAAGAPARVFCFQCASNPASGFPPVRALAGNEGGRLAAGLENGGVLLLNESSSSGRAAISRELPAPVTALAYGSGHWLVAGTAEGEMALLNDEDLSRGPNLVCDDCGPVEAIAWQGGESSTLAAAYSDARIRFFGRKGAELLRTTGKEINTSAAKSRITALAFWPSSTLVATGHDDGSVRIWDVRNGSELAASKLHEASVLSLLFDTQTGKLVSVSADGDIHRSPLKLDLFGRMWDLKTLLLADEGRTLRQQLDEVSRRELGYDPEGEEPEPGPEAPAKALRYFPKRTAVHRD